MTSVASSRRAAALLGSVLVAVSLVAGCVTVAPEASPSSSAPSLAPTEAPSIPVTTAEPTGTAQPTATPEPSATAEPTATAAPVTPEPSATPAADVIFSDDFSGTIKYLSSGGQDGFGLSEYADGVFRIEAERREGYVNWQQGASRTGCSGVDCQIADVTHDEIDAAVVEVDATHLAGSIAAPYGITCSFQGTGTIGSFVGLTISADGRHHAITYTHAPGALPLTFVQGGALWGDVNPAINTEPGATNHLRAECDGQRFALFVNGQPVASGDFGEPVADSDFNRGVGLIAGAGPDGAVRVEFDNLVVTELDAAVTPTEQSGVIFADPLTTDIGWWPMGDLGYMTTEFTDSAFRVSVPDANTGGWLSPSGWVLPADVSMAVDATFVEGPELSYAQLMCRNVEGSSYRFALGADGAFSLQRLAEGTSTKLVDWGSPSDAANVGAGTTNNLRFDCNDDILTGVLNEQVVASEIDSTLTDAGAGFGAVSTIDEGGTVYDFINYVVRYPETL